MAVGTQLKWSNEGDISWKSAHGKKESLMYLCYVLSKSTSNMPNVSHKRHKSIVTQKHIPKLIEPLGLYRFESAFIYIEALLRSSILYGAETMCNVKENDYREYEKN